MNNRALDIASFLEQSGWGEAEPTPFMADFSPRRYARLTRTDGATAILMDADADQRTYEFVEIDAVLRSLGLSAPEIYAAQPEQGLLLLENFGKQNFGRLIDSGQDAKPLYKLAVDVLAHLHKNFTSTDGSDLDLPCFGGALFAAQVEFFLDYYLPYALDREATRDEGEAFRAAWKETLRGIESLPQSLLLRDYMPDNLMLLPDRTGVKSVGLLDFQDAGFGPTAYDLASLCEVVRRDGGDLLLDEMIAYYYAQAKPDLTITELTSACRVLAAQRHMRILGILVRVAARTGDREKLSYMPRIWGYLRFLVQDEALQTVQKWLQKMSLV